MTGLKRGVVGLFLAAGLLAAQDPVDEWIRGNAIRLTTPVPGHGFDDMQPLKKVVGDARIVSLGEATHGTREFFQMKHRVLEFLATEMGFTVFAIEANMPEASELNGYLGRGSGDPAQLIRGMHFWAWDTEEVLDMVRWMRDFNQSGKGHVEFMGFDMQAPKIAIEALQLFVAKADPEYAETLAKASELVDPKAASEEWSKVVKHLEVSQFPAQKGEVDQAIQSARLVLQSMQMKANQMPRDASMAANVKWIVDQRPGQKIVLWAHNAHVMTSGGASMGSALRKMYGDQMVTFGFAFDQGSFQARPEGGEGLKNFTVPPAPAGSLDATLSASGIPLFALDLRTAPKSGPVADWWKSPHETCSIGTMYPENQPYARLVKQVAPEAFDVILFVDKTTAARKNAP